MFYSYGQRPSPSVDRWYMVWIIYYVHMITGDECGQTFLIFVLRLRENSGKNLNQEIHQPGIEPGPAAWEVTMLPIDHSGARVKHVAMQRCHIAQWHDGLNRPGRQGCRSGRPHVENKTVQLLAFLSDGSRQWTARELTAEVGICRKTVIHIVHDILCYRKLSTLWIPHEISEVQQWHRYADAQALLDRYQREGDDFHGRIVAMDETWARSYVPHLIRQSNEWKHPGSPRRRKVRPTQCAVKVMFIVTYDIDGVILHHALPPRQMVNAAYYCT